MPRPNLKITGLHIEGLKALRRVDWPADGMGWGDVVPDMVMLGGANGSGKTTLLEFVVETMCCLQRQQPPFVGVMRSINAWIRMELAMGWSPEVATLVLGDAGFHQAWSAANPGNAEATIATDRLTIQGSAALVSHVPRVLADPVLYAKSSLPGVVYLPSDRSLVLPEEPFKSPGLLEEPDEFIYIFRPPKTWKESLEGLLYSARWTDLNAKEEGRPQDATRFQAFADAFALFFEGRKQVAWRNGKLVVALADGATTHGLAELSSGEMQVIILAAVLLYRWRPGSLILIDEPESHLHPTWLTRLWSMLTRWQQERGGQVIVATQSNHLFRIGEPGTKVLLGQDSLA